MSLTASLDVVTVSVKNVRARSNIVTSWVRRRSGCVPLEEHLLGRSAAELDRAPIDEREERHALDLRGRAIGERLQRVDIVHLLSRQRDVGTHRAASLRRSREGDDRVVLPIVRYVEGEGVVLVAHAAAILRPSIDEDRDRGRHRRSVGAAGARL